MTDAKLAVSTLVLSQILFSSTSTNAAPELLITPDVSANWTTPASTTETTDPPFVPFNSSWCASVRNLKDVPIDEERFENLKERICFGHNDTVKEALLVQMREILEKRNQIDVIFDKIVAMLSNGNVERKTILMAAEYGMPEEEAGVECYLETNFVFQDSCAKLSDDNSYLIDMMRILAHACNANWLQTADIGEVIREVCRPNKELIKGAI